MKFDTDDEVQGNSKDLHMADLDSIDKMNDINDLNRVIQRTAKYFKTHIIKYNFDPKDKSWDINELFPILLNMKDNCKLLTSKNPKNLKK